MQQTPDLGRRLFCGAAAATAASTLGLLSLSERSNAMNQVAQQKVPTELPSVRFM